MRRFFCRKCKSRFPDFDWNTICHEFIFDNVELSKSQNDYEYLHKNEVSLDKDKYKFSVLMIISVCGMLYGFYNSLLVYYICLLLGGFLGYKYYNLIFEIFGIKVVMGRVGDRLIINDKKIGYMLFVVSLMYFFAGMPIYFFNYEFIVISLVMFIFALNFLMWGVVVFFNSSAYNNFSNYVCDPLTFVVSFLGNMIFLLPLIYVISKIGFNIVLLLVMILQLLAFVSISTDVLNRFTRHDLRLDPYIKFFSWYSFLVPFTGFVLLIICDTLLGWNIFFW